jgi:alkanesulfonate monooxygenase SsuD/methylene tetrahydromethanopterin reductase-like flavin-dependent oxidoreductase (luciferase family)
MAEYIQKVRQAAVSFGRDPYDVKIFVAIMPFLGKTVEEAQAKYDKAQALLSVQSNLAKLSGFTGVDLSKYPLKEPFKFSGPDSKDGAIVGSIQNMTLLSEEATEPVTPEMFAKTFKWPFPIGTPEMVGKLHTRSWKMPSRMFFFQFLSFSGNANVTISGCFPRVDGEE